MYSSLAHSQPMLLILLVKLGPCLLLSSTSQGSPLLLTLQRTTSRGPRLLLTPLTSLYLSCLLLALMLQRISRVRLLLPASMRRTYNGANSDGTVAVASGPPFAADVVTRKRPSLATVMRDMRT